MTDEVKAKNYFLTSGVTTAFAGSTADACSTFNACGSSTFKVQG
jgi:hypothetical protein